MPCGYEMKKTKSEVKSLDHMEGWSDLRVVKSGNAYITDGSQYFNRPGPRLLDSIKIMHDIINDTDSYGFHGAGWEKIIN